MRLRNYTKTNSLLLGVTAIIVQIILLREFLVVFYGNELCVGLILASWLFWVAAGSQMGNRIKHQRGIPSLFFILQAAEVIAAFVAIYLIKIIRTIAGVPIGEHVSILDITWAAFAILSVPCFLLGIQFALLATTMLKSDTPKGDPSAHVYIYESLGSLIASLIFSLLIVHWFSNLQTLILLLAMISLIAGIELSHRWLYISTILITILVLSPIPQSIESKLVELQWKTFNRNFDVVDWQNSRYGQLAVIEWGGEKSLYHNGLKQTIIPDPIGTQQTAHLIMNQHPRPRSVLLIGGGMGGLAEEILKYQGCQLDYLELDNKVCSVMQKHLPLVDSPFWKNPNLRIQHLDGRYFLPRNDTPYDIIIVNVGEPSTASSNRYYTLEFFRDAKSRLASTGILALCNVPSSADYFGPEMLKLNASIYHTLKQVFDHLLVIPGMAAVFLASTQANLLTFDIDLLSKRYVERNIECDYFFKELFWQLMPPDRIAFVRENLELVQHPIINRDFRPISYYFDLLLWNKIVRGSHPLLPLLGRLRLSSLVLVVLILFAIYLSIVTIVRRKQRILRIANVILLTIAVGFAGMVFSIVLILAFQTVFGYVYELVGLALAGFMGGLALGSYFFNRTLPSWSKRKFTLPLLGIAVAGFSALLPLLLDLLLAWRSYILFFTYLLIAGFLVGAVFPVACNEFYRITGRRRVGTIYAADLVGGCLGSLLASAFLVPILGLYQVCWFAAITTMLAAVCYLVICR